MKTSIFDYLKNKKFKSINDLVDTLNLIGPYIDGWSLTNQITKGQLVSYCTTLKRKESYNIFKIPKKSGGHRTIVAPIENLKKIQRALLKYLEGVFIPNQNATGFISGKSIKDNALMHIGKNCIINLDLENFFPSITKDMLKDAIRNELSDSIPSDEVINTICNLCTIPIDDNMEVLAQGASTSPLLSNIVMKKFDEYVESFCKERGMVYSRYADDITLSFNSTNENIQDILSHFRGLVESYGLKLNEDKIKVLKKGTRQEVTGIIANEKANLSRSFVKQLRVFLHLWEKNGYEEAQTIYQNDFRNHKPGELQNVIKGKLNYLRMIKGNQDSTFIKLNKRYMGLLWHKKKEEKLKADNKSLKEKL